MPDPNIVGKAKLVATAPGSAIITVTTADGGYMAICKVSVSFLSVTSINLGQNTATVNVNENIKLTATIAPSYATNKNLTWASSNESIVTIDQSGNITGIKAGSATITAASVSNPGVKASCIVTVTQPVTGISLSPDAATMNIGETIKLKLTVIPNNASVQFLLLNTDNPSVASINSADQVTALSPGTATISCFLLNDPSISASSVITVNKIAVDSIALNPNTPNTTIGLNGNQQLNVLFSPTNATYKSLQWTSSDSSSVSVSNGFITGLKVTSTPVAITAVSLDNPNASISISVSVTPASVTLTDFNIPATQTLEVGKTANIYTSYRNKPTDCLEHKQPIYSIR